MFSAPTEARPNDKVLFDATASLDRNDDPLTYMWNFGDGKSGSKRSPYISHRYAEPGTYKARLTVSDGRGGSDSVLHTISIVTMRMDGRVLFDFDKAVLKQGAEKILAPILKQLKADARYHVRLAGYTDSTGPKGYNLRLSEKRALAVKTYLVKNGIAEHRISVSGMGKNNPIATNSTTAGRAKNRRTEITIMLK
jgi:outer membrane protein OmpA-like peptidoglycan-associated protein